MPLHESKPHLKAPGDQQRTAGIPQPSSLIDTASNDASVADYILDAKNDSTTLDGVQSQTSAAAPASMQHTAAAETRSQPLTLQDERDQSRDDLPAGRPETRFQMMDPQPATESPPATPDVAPSALRPRSRRGARRDFAKLLKTATFRAPFYEARITVAPPQEVSTTARNATSGAKRAARVRQRYARDAASWQRTARHHQHKVQPSIKGGYCVISLVPRVRLIASKSRLVATEST